MGKFILTQKGYVNTDHVVSWESGGGTRGYHNRLTLVGGELVATNVDERDLTHDDHFIPNTTGMVALEVGYDCSCTEEPNEPMVRELPIIGWKQEPRCSNWYLTPVVPMYDELPSNVRLAVKFREDEYVVNPDMCCDNCTREKVIELLVRDIKMMEDIKAG